MKSRSSKNSLDFFGNNLAALGDTGDCAARQPQLRAGSAMNDEGRPGRHSSGQKIKQKFNCKAVFHFQPRVEKLSLYRAIRFAI